MAYNASYWQKYAAAKRKKWLKAHRPTRASIGEGWRPTGGGGITRQPYGAQYWAVRNAKAAYDARKGAEWRGAFAYAAAVKRAEAQRAAAQAAAERRINGLTVSTATRLSEHARDQARAANQRANNRIKMGNRRAGVTGGDTFVPRRGPSAERYSGVNDRRAQSGRDVPVSANRRYGFTPSPSSQGVNDRRVRNAPNTKHLYNEYGVWKGGNNRPSGTTTANPRLYSHHAGVDPDSWYLTDKQKKEARAGTGEFAHLIPRNPAFRRLNSGGTTRAQYDDAFGTGAWRFDEEGRVRTMSGPDRRLSGGSRWTDGALVASLGGVNTNKSLRYADLQSNTPKPLDRGPWYARAAQTFLGNPVAQTLLEGIAWPQEQIAQAYYASAYSEETGGSTLEQTASFFAGLPGLGFVAPGGSQVRKNIEATNSWEERAELSERGILPSFGQSVVGIRPNEGGWLNIPAAALDLTFQLATDPLTYATYGTVKAASLSLRSTSASARAGIRANAIGGSLSRAARARSYLAPVANLKAMTTEVYQNAARLSVPGGTVAGRPAIQGGARAAREIAQEGADIAFRQALEGGRAVWLAETRTGRAYRAALANVLTENVKAAADPATLRHVVKGLSYEDATRIALNYSSSGTQTIDDAVEGVMQAIIRGSFDPKVTIRRQIFGASPWKGLGSRAIAARGVPLGLGPKTLRSANGGFVRAMKRAATEIAPEGARLTTGTLRMFDEIATNATAYLDEYNYPPDFLKAHLGEDFVGKNFPQDRLKLVMDDIGDFSTFDAAVTGDEMDVFAAYALMESSEIVKLIDEGDLAQAMQRVRSLEATALIMDGKGNDEALAAALAMMANSGIDPTSTNLTHVINRAIAVQGGKAKDVLPRRKPWAKVSRVDEMKARLANPGSRSIYEANVRGADRKLGAYYKRRAAWYRQNPFVEGQPAPVYPEEVLEKIPLHILEDNASHAHARLKTWLDRDILANRIHESNSAKLRKMNEDLAKSGYGPEGLPKTPNNIKMAELRIDQLPSSIQTMFKAELINQSANDAIEDLYPLIRQVDALLNDPELAKNADIIARAQVARLNTISQSHIVQQALPGPGATIGLGKSKAKAVGNIFTRAPAQAADAVPRRIANRPLRGFARLIVSISQQMSPSTIPWETGPNAAVNLKNRLEHGQRWLWALGFGDEIELPFKRALMEAQSPTDIHNLVEEALTVFAIHHKVDPDLLLNPWRDSLGGTTRFFNAPDELAPQVGARLAKNSNTPGLTERVLQSQEIMEIPLLNPQEAHAIVRNELAKQALMGRGSVTGALHLPRVAGQHIIDAQLGSSRFTLRNFGRKTHTFWKFAVVTNMPAVASGFVAGALGGGLEDDPSIWDRGKWAVFGGAIGALGGIRYIGRVVGIEERLIRYNIVRGFRPIEHIPGISKWQSERGPDLLFRLGDELHALPTHPSHSKLLMTETDDWVVIAANQTRFVDGYHRIINYQINPETDLVMQRLLQARVGVDGWDLPSWKLKMGRWLKESDDGIKYMDRINAGAGASTASRTVDEQLDIMEQFVRRYLPDDEQVRARLAQADIVDGEVTMGVVKQWVKDGMHPESVHARQTWLVPRGPGDLWHTVWQVPPRMVLETPTAKISREPMARWFYKDEFTRLRNMGFEPEDARRYAEEFAVERTNAPMFRLTEESRFAQKIDPIFPFQQPREEMIRVYGQLAVQNPGRVARATRLGALAVNNGIENGIFTKDEFTGQYVMTVPGSAWISRMLGAPEMEFTFGLKDAFFLLQGSLGSNHSAADIDFGDLMSVAESVLPSPGGPFWTAMTRLAFNRYPDALRRLQDDHRWLYDRLFGYGVMGYVGRAEARRTWQALTGQRHAPWEFASKFEQEEEMRKWEQNVFLELLWEHRKEHPDDLEWLPSLDDVTDGVRAMLLAHSVIGSVVPAPTRPNMAYRDPINAIIDRYETIATDREGRPGIDWEKLYDEAPELAPFLQRTTEDYQPDKFEEWARAKDQRNYFDEFAKHNRTRLTIENFRDSIQESRKRAEVSANYYNQFSNPNLIEREAELRAIRDRNPDFVPDTEYDRIKYVAQVIMTYPKWAREGAINRWRQQNPDISYEDYLRYRKKAKGFRINPWAEARHMEDVVKAVDEAERRGYSPGWFVRQLMPAEQLRYNTFQMMQLHYVETDYYGNRLGPGAVLSQYDQLKAEKSRIYSEHPELYEGAWTRRKNPVENTVDQWKGDYRQAIQDLNTQIYDVLKPGMDNARDQKDWTTYYALKDKQQGLYDLLKAIKNKQYREMPHIQSMQDDLMAFIGLNRPAGLTKGKVKNMSAAGVTAAYRQYIKDGTPWMPSNEENAYLQMTPDLKRAYTADLVNRLNVPAGDYDHHIGGYKTTKYFWDYLTDFQRDLLKRNYPVAMINAWQLEDPGAKNGRSGYYKSGRRRGYYRRSNYYRGGGSGNPALDYAYSLFKEYTQRPDGAKPPAAYQGYLALPDDPALRKAYLDKHPEVREWIASGPMANMPPVLAYMVADIMIRNGKWEGSPRTMTEITELAWAEEQFARFNQRGAAKKPTAYDKWLAMPTGQAKADYLRAHPEIGRWLQLGPMSNMPEAYKTVIRDIMLRYGKWTSAQDPLGKLLEKFHSIPRHSKEAFLIKHPEINAYFDALRDPKEQRQHDLMQHYFRLTDSMSKRIYLASHPELEDYFVESRTSRYENFLNQVAQQMGANPNLFKKYLDRQEDVLHELIRRFGTIPLIRENYGNQENADVKGRSETGRVRKKSG